MPGALSLSGKPPFSGSLGPVPGGPLRGADADLRAVLQQQVQQGLDPFHLTDPPLGVHVAHQHGAESPDGVVQGLRGHGFGDDVHEPFHGPPEPRPVVRTLRQSRNGPCQAGARKGTERGAHPLTRAVAGRCQGMPMAFHTVWRVPPLCTPPLPPQPSQWHPGHCRRQWIAHPPMVQKPEDCVSDTGAQDRVLSTVGVCGGVLSIGHTCTLSPPLWIGPPASAAPTAPLLRRDRLLCPCMQSLNAWNTQFRSLCMGFVDRWCQGLSFRVYPQVFWTKKKAPRKFRIPHSLPSQPTLDPPIPLKGSLCTVT